MIPVILILGRWLRRRAAFVAIVDKIPGPPALPIIGNALQAIGLNSVGKYVIFETM